MLSRITNISLWSAFSRQRALYQFRALSAAPPKSCQFLCQSPLWLALLIAINLKNFLFLWSGFYLNRQRHELRLFLIQKSALSTLQPLLRYCGSQPINEITFQDLETYLTTLNHLLPKTQHRHRTIIGCLFNYGIEQGYLIYNPLTRLLKLNQKNSEESITYLTPEQLQVLYQSLEQDCTPNGDRLHAVVCLLHCTGAKVSEILALDLEQIDFKYRQFQIKNRCFYTQDVASVLERYIQYSRLQSPRCLALFTATNRRNKNITRLSYSILYQDWKKLI